MKNTRIVKINRFLRIYVAIGAIIAIVGVLAMQTHLSILNQEYNANKNELAEVQERNQYMKMQRNESLTFDKVQEFATANGLSQNIPNIVDVDNFGESAQ